MSDIVFTRKIGDGAVARPQSPGAATSATATVANLPASLSDATVGTLIKALVTGQTLRGLTTLQTENGTLTLQTNVPLKVGSELVLQIQSVGTQTRIAILSVDNHPLTGEKRDQVPRPLGQPRTTQAAPPDQPKAAATSTSQAASRPLPSVTQPGREPVQRPPVTATDRNATAVTVRADAVSEVKGPVTPGLVLPARVIAAGIPAPFMKTPPAGSAKTLMTGDILTIRVLALEHVDAGAEPKPPSVESGGPVLRGVIVAQDAPAANKMSIFPPPVETSTQLAVGTGRIVLPALPPGPPGGKILFEILDAHPIAPGQQAPVADDIHQDFLRLGVDWKSLRDTAALLASREPTSRQGGGDLVPRPGPKMAAAVLSFVSALKTGDIHAWLGADHMQHLAQASGGQLLNQFRTDFTTMSHHAGDALGTGWHALAIPVDTGAHVEQFRLYYRQQNGDQGTSHDESATHFMVEADLSRIGLFQLEGLVRPRQFDLVVHSAQALSGDMRSTIRNIFQDALSTGGLAGTIRFDGGTERPFNPTGTPTPSNRHLAAVIV